MKYKKNKDQTDSLKQKQVRRSLDQSGVIRIKNEEPDSVGRQVAEEPGKGQCTCW